MSVRLQRYSATAVAFGLIALSFGIFALGSAGVLPTNGVWRALVIPAYIPMLLSAVVATRLSLPGAPLWVFVGIGVTILPFLAFDWVRARRRRPDSPAA